MLSGEYGGTGIGHRTQQILDINRRKALGCDLDFDNNIMVLLKSRLPDGSVNEVFIKVADVILF